MNRDTVYRSDEEKIAYVFSGQDQRIQVEYTEQEQPVRQSHLRLRIGQAAGFRLETEEGRTFDGPVVLQLGDRRDIEALVSSLEGAARFLRRHGVGEGVQSRNGHEVPRIRSNTASA